MSSTRRRIGVSIATTEAARRQLMQPVPCWEKRWETPVDAAPGSTFKVYKWVKTEKKQQFSDDEDETLDEPLAPLPDEPDGDDDLDQDEVATASQTGGQASMSVSRAVSEPVVPPDQDGPSGTRTTKPHPLSMSVVPDSPTQEQAIDEDALDAALKPLETELEVPGGLGDDADVSLVGPADLNAGGLVDLDMSSLGPDGEPFEASGDLTQLQGTDALLGGDLMDQSNDPFSPPK